MYTIRKQWPSRMIGVGYTASSKPLNYLVSNIISTGNVFIQNNNTMI